MPALYPKPLPSLDILRSLNTTGPNTLTLHYQPYPTGILPKSTAISTIHQVPRKKVLTRGHGYGTRPHAIMEQLA